jgi:hypothetical protein
MLYIFISYSKHNISFVRHLRSLFTDKGFAVWMDETPPSFDPQAWPTIEANIRAASAFLVIMSPEAQKSQRVRRELQVAHQHNKPIHPILLSGKPWGQLADLQHVVMTSGKSADLPWELVDSLLNFVPVSSPESVPPPLPGKKIPELIDDEIERRKADFRPSYWWLLPLVRILMGIIPLIIIVLFMFYRDGIDKDSPNDAVKTESALLPSPVSTHSGTEIEVTLQAEISVTSTETDQTEFVGATLWTQTPTIDVRATVNTRLTATQVVADTQSAQLAADASATATLWTVTPTYTPSPTDVPTETPTETFTPTITPSHTPSPTITLTVTLTPIPTRTPLPSHTPTSTATAIVPNSWNVGITLYIQETTGLSGVAGQLPNRPEQFNPGDEVMVGMGNVAPGQRREWYIVPASQERWWFIDELGGGWLPESVLGDESPVMDEPTPLGDNS